LTPPECEGLQGFPNRWTLPEPYIKLAENELDSLRYAALGNAVCVPVVEWIAKRIKKEWISQKHSFVSGKLKILAANSSGHPEGTRGRAIAF
jgi:DNA (cytosine-5)-methyltransferase 1